MTIIMTIIKAVHKTENAWSRCSMHVSPLTTPVPQNAIGKNPKTSV